MDVTKYLPRESTCIGTNSQTLYRFYCFKNYIVLCAQLVPDKGFIRIRTFKDICLNYCMSTNIERQTIIIDHPG